MNRFLIKTIQCMQRLGWGVLFFGVTVIVLINCSGKNPANAGITTIPNTVAGTIVDEDGNAVENAEITMYPSDYNPISDNLIPDSLKTTTDENGQYQLNNIPANQYNIVAYLPMNGSKAFINNVPVVSEQENIAPEGQLENSGSVQIPLNEISTDKEGYIYIPGTDIYQKIDTNTTVLVLPEVPSGDYSEIILIINSQDTSGTNIIQDTVMVTADDTLSLAVYRDWQYSKKILLNTSLISTNNDVINFPVMIRLTSQEIDYNQAYTSGDDIRFTKSDRNTILPYQIESWNPSGTSIVWIKMDTVFANNDSQHIYMYWGNEHALPLSDGGVVFDTTAGFSGVWHLNEKSNIDSKSYKDATNYQNHGSGFGFEPSNSNSGLIGNGQYFDGVNDFIEVETNSTLNFKKITMSAWINIETAGGRVFDKITVGGQDGFLLDTHGDSIRMIVDSLHFKKSSPLDKNKFIHIASTYDGNKAVLYLNGEIVFEIDTVKSIPFNDFNLRIGADQDANSGNGFGSYHTGYFDELRISRVIRHSDWIKLCYENQKKDQLFIEYE